MDEHGPVLTKPDLTDPPGDVDDLIFLHDPDWSASDR